MAASAQRRAHQRYVGVTIQDARQLGVHDHLVLAGIRAEAHVNGSGLGEPAGYELRRRLGPPFTAPEGQSATFVELFFDLV